jgi:RNA polymerase sigma factor (sigma-70 family)
VRVEETGFADEAGPLRREILAHCYRMLGSAADAEDAVQETYLRAWRGFDRFERRASIRTWLHQIATNVCLRSLEQRERRFLPAALAGPESDWHSPPGPRRRKRPGWDRFRSIRPTRRARTSRCGSPSSPRCSISRPGSERF